MPNAEDVLRHVLDKIIEEPYKNGAVSLKALVPEGGNFMTAGFFITITKHEEVLNLFGKVANVSGKLRERFDIEKIYNVAPEYSFTRVCPKYYGGDSTEGEETVVLEDIVPKGYSTYSRFRPIDWEHAAIAVESLARFHALSFAFEKEDPENFAKVIDKMSFREQRRMLYKELWPKVINGAVEVAKEEHKEAVSRCLLDALLKEELYKCKKPLLKPVLCHGDFRTSNLLFRRQNGRLETMVLDYQTVHTGCAPMDLLYLEFMGTDEEFRRENHHRLVDYYFEQLTLALDRLGVDINEVYPRETFDAELKQMLPVAFRSASFILPLVLVEADRAPQLGKCENVETIAVSPNQLFAERFNGIISDCVRWGVI